MNNTSLVSDLFQIFIKEDIIRIKDSKFSFFFLFSDLGLRVSVMSQTVTCYMIHSQVTVT